MSDYLPYSIEAEQSTIGGLLLDFSVWPEVSEMLVAENFYLPEHEIIFNAIAKNADKNPDILILSEYLERHSQMDQVGGIAYLAQMIKDTASVANIMSYATAVKDRYILREIVKSCNHTVSVIAARGDDTVEMIIDSHKTQVTRVESQYSGAATDIQSVTDVLKRTYAKIREAAESKKDFIGLASGFDSIDRVMLGFENGDMIVVGGRPSHGKTTLAMNIAENVAITQSKGVVVFSMEMTSDQLMNRMIASQSRVPLKLIRTGKLSPENWNSISFAVKSINSSSMKIIDEPGLNIRRLRKYAMKVAESMDVDLIVIDYLQLMSASNPKESRNYQIEEISRGIKELAKEMDLPIIVLSQLSRSIEQRKDKRPLLSDLRDSGAIEQDADVIMFVYRDEVYNKNSPNRGICDLIGAKFRNGQPSDIRLNFQGQYTKFQDIPEFGSDSDMFDYDED